MTVGVGLKDTAFVEFDPTRPNELQAPFNRAFCPDPNARVLQRSLERPPGASNTTKPWCWQRRFHSSRLSSSSTCQNSVPSFRPFGVTSNPDMRNHLSSLSLWITRTAPWPCPSGCGAAQARR